MALENKLGITNSAELAREEERISKKKAVELFESGALDKLAPGRFASLQAIHKALFENIYDFAGELRTVNLAKGNFRFATLMYLEAALANIDKMPQSTFDEIIEKALAYKIVFVGPEIIDRDNILNATMGGMKQAVEELDIVPNLVLVDGNRVPAGLQIPAQPVVKGDATSASIGAASILAKVSRDRYMLELDKQYPQYQLAKHKGYPTKLHYELIAQYGIQPFYRRSFLKKQGYWPENGK